MRRQTGAILANQVDDELARLKTCLDETLAELDHYAQRIEAEFDSALAGIFRAHGVMLRDLFLRPSSSGSCGRRC